MVQSTLTPTQQVQSSADSFIESYRALRNQNNSAAARATTARLRSESESRRKQDNVSTEVDTGIDMTGRGKAEWWESATGAVRQASDTVANLTGLDTAFDDQGNFKWGDPTSYVRFAGALPFMAITAPFTGATQLVEWATGSDIASYDFDTNTINEERLSGAQRWASLGNAAINIGGTFIGGTGALAKGAVGLAKGVGTAESAATRAVLRAQRQGKTIEQAQKAAQKAAKTPALLRAAEAVDQNMGGVGAFLFNTGEEALEEFGQQYLDEIRDYGELQEGVFGRALQGAALGGMGGAAFHGASRGLNFALRELQDRNEETSVERATSPWEALTEMRGTGEGTLTPTAQAAMEDMARASTLPATGSATVTTADPSLRVKINEKAVGIETVRAIYNRDADSKAAMEAWFGAAADNDIAARIRSALAKEDADAITDMQALLDAVNDRRSATWRTPATARGSVMQLDLRYIIGGAGIKTHPAVPQVPGGDVDGDLLALTFSTRSDDWRYPTSLTVDPNTGGEAWDMSYLHITDKNNGIRSINAALSSVIDPDTGQPLTRDQIKALTRNFKAKDKGLPHFVQDLVNLTDDAVAADVIQQITESPNMQAAWQAQFIEQQQAQAIEFARSIMEGVELPGIYDSGSTGGADNLSQLAAFLGWLTENTPNNIFFRQIASKIMDTSTIPKFADGVLIEESQSVFTELFAHMMNISAYGETPASQIRGMFERMVLADVSQQLAGRKVGQEGSVPFDEFLEMYRMAHNRAVKVWSEAVKQTNYRDDIFIPKELSGPAWMEENKTSFVEFRKIFGNFEFDAFFDVKGNEALEGKTMDEWAFEKSTKGIYDVMEVSPLGETNTGKGNRAIQFFTGYINSFGANAKMKSANVEALLDANNDIKLELNEDGTLKLVDGRIPLDDVKSLYMLLDSFNAVLGKGTTIRMGIGSLESLLKTRWAKAILSGDKDARMNAIFTIGLEDVARDYITCAKRLEADPTNVSLRRKAIYCAKQFGMISPLHYEIVVNIVNSPSETGPLNDELLLSMLDMDISYAHKAAVFEESYPGMDLLGSALFHDTSPFAEADVRKRIGDMRQSMKRARDYSYKKMMTDVNQVRDLTRTAGFSDVEACEALVYKLANGATEVDFNLIAGMVDDARQLLRAHGSKAADTHNTNMAYLSLLQSINGGQFSMVDLMSAVSTRTFFAEDFVNNSVLMRMLLSNPDFEVNWVFRSTGKYCKMNRETFFAIRADVELKGKPPTWNDWMKLFEADPTLSYLVCDLTASAVVQRQSVKETYRQTPAEAIATSVVRKTTDIKAYQKQMTKRRIRQLAMNQPQFYQFLVAMTDDLSKQGLSNDQIRKSLADSMDTFVEAIYHDLARSKGTDDFEADYKLAALESAFSNLDEHISRTKLLDGLEQQSWGVAEGAVNSFVRDVVSDIALDAANAAIQKISKRAKKVVDTSISFEDDLDEFIESGEKVVTKMGADLLNVAAQILAAYSDELSQKNAPRIVTKTIEQVKADVTESVNGNPTLSARQKVRIIAAASKAVDEAFSSERFADLVDDAIGDVVTANDINPKITSDADFIAKLEGLRHLSPSHPIPSLTDKDGRKVKLSMAQRQLEQRFWNNEILSISVRGLSESAAGINTRVVGTEMELRRFYLRFLDTCRRDEKVITPNLDKRTKNPVEIRLHLTDKSLAFSASMVEQIAESARAAQVTAINGAFIDIAAPLAVLPGDATCGLPLGEATVEEITNDSDKYIGHIVMWNAADPTRPVRRFVNGEVLAEMNALVDKSITVEVASTCNCGHGLCWLHPKRSSRIGDQQALSVGQLFAAWHDWSMEALGISFVKTAFDTDAVVDFDVLGLYGEATNIPRLDPNQPIQPQMEAIREGLAERFKDFVSKHDPHKKLKWGHEQYLLFATYTTPSVSVTFDDGSVRVYSFEELAGQNGIQSVTAKRNSEVMGPLPQGQAPPQYTIQTVNIRVSSPIELSMKAQRNIERRYDAHMASTPDVEVTGDDLGRWALEGFTSWDEYTEATASEIKTAMNRRMPPSFGSRSKVVPGVSPTPKIAWEDIVQESLVRLSSRGKPNARKRRITKLTGPDLQLIDRFKDKTHRDSSYTVSRAFVTTSRDKVPDSQWRVALEAAPLANIEGDTMGPMNTRLFIGDRSDGSKGLFYRALDSAAANRSSIAIPSGFDATDWFDESDHSGMFLMPESLVFEIDGALVSFDVYSLAYSEEMDSFEEKPRGSIVYADVQRSTYIAAPDYNITSNSMSFLNPETFADSGSYRSGVAYNTKQTYMEGAVRSDAPIKALKSSTLADLSRMTRAQLRGLFDSGLLVLKDMNGDIDKQLNDLQTFFTDMAAKGTNDFGFITKDVRPKTIIGLVAQTLPSGDTRYAPVYLSVPEAPSVIRQLTAEVDATTGEIRLEFGEDVPITEDSDQKMYFDSQPFKAYTAVLSSTHHFPAIALTDNTGQRVRMKADILTDGRELAGLYEKMGAERFFLANLWHYGRRNGYSLFRTWDRATNTWKVKPGLTREAQDQLDRLEDPQDLSIWEDVYAGRLRLFKDAQVNAVIRKILYRTVVEKRFPSGFIFSSIVQHGTDAKGQPIFGILNAKSDEYAAAFEDLSIDDLMLLFNTFDNSFCPPSFDAPLYKTSQTGSDKVSQYLFNNKGQMLMNYWDAKLRAERQDYLWVAIGMHRFGHDTTNRPQTGQGRFSNQARVQMSLSQGRVSDELLDTMMQNAALQVERWNRFVYDFDDVDGITHDRRMPSYAQREDFDSGLTRYVGSARTLAQAQHDRKIARIGYDTYTKIPLRIKNDKPVSETDPEFDPVWDAIQFANDNLRYKLPLTFWYAVHAHYTGRTHNDRNSGDQKIFIDELVNSITTFTRRIMSGKDAHSSYPIPAIQTGKRYSVPLMPQGMSRLAWNSPVIRAKFNDDYDSFIDAGKVLHGEAANMIATETNQRQRIALQDFLEYIEKDHGFVTNTSRMYENFTFEDMTMVTNELLKRLSPDLMQRQQKWTAEQERTVEHLKRLKQYLDRQGYDFSESGRATRKAPANIAERTLNNAAMISQAWAVLDPLLATSAVMERFLGNRTGAAPFAIGKFLGRSPDGRFRGVVPFVNQVPVADEDLEFASSNKDAVFLYLAVREVGLSNDQSIFFNMNTMEEARQYMEQRMAELGYGKRIAALNRIAIAAASGGNFFMRGQIKNMWRQFASMVGERGQPGWGDVEANGKTVLSNQMGTNPAGLFLSLLTANEAKAHPDRQLLMNSIQYSLKSEMAQRNIMTVLYNNIAERSPAFNFFTKTTICRFFNYTTNITGRALHWILPMSSLNYLVTNRLANTKWGQEHGITDDLQMFSSMKEALLMDMMRFGAQTCVLVLLSLFDIEPPEDKDKWGIAEEWTINGVAIKTTWWMQDIMGPALPMLIYTKTVINGKPRPDIVINGLGDVLMNNPVSKVGDMIGFLFSPEENFLNEWGEEVEDWAELTGEDVSFSDWAVVNAQCFGLSWLNQFLTPAFVRTIANEMTSADAEASYTRIFEENAQGQLTDAGAEGKTMYTTFADSRIRRITRNRPALALFMDLISGGNDTSYYSNGTIINDLAMPVTMYQDPFQRASLEHFALYNEDGSDKDEQTRQALAIEALTTLMGYDDMEELRSDGFIMSGDFRYFLGQTIWDIITEETNNYYAWKASEDANYYVLGDGDYETGRQLYNEITNEFYADKAFWESIYYDKLKSEAMSRGVQYYTRMKTTYREDAAGEVYATGFTTSDFFPFKVLQGETATNLGKDEDWASPSAVVEGESLGMRGLRPVKGQYDELPDSLDAFADPTQNGYSSNWGNSNSYTNDAYSRYGGGGKGGSGGSSYIYSRLPSMSPSRAEQMRTDRLYDTNFDYLRPSFETKGSREASRREDF